MSYLQEILVTHNTSSHYSLKEKYLQFLCDTFAKNHLLRPHMWSRSFLKVVANYINFFIINDDITPSLNYIPRSEPSHHASMSFAQIIRGPDIMLLMPHID